MLCPKSRGFDFPQHLWVLPCNFARQVLLVTASSFCSSSGWLWVAALPYHRNPAEAWERCNIQHFATEVWAPHDGRSTGTSPHPPPSPPPHPLTSLAGVPAVTQCNHGWYFTRGWKPTAVQGTVATRGKRRAAQPKPTARDYLKGCMGHQGAALTRWRTNARDFIDGSHQVPESSHKHSLWDTQPFRQARQLAGRDLHRTVNASSFKNNLPLANKVHCHTT